MLSGLYLHIPFCLQKCGYCGFYSIPVGNEDPGGYIRALGRELELYNSLDLKEVTSIYLGGGTPTVLAADQLGDLIRNITYSVPETDDLEFTIEANPETVDPEKFQKLKSLQVNRVSLGIQSFNDRILKILGRVHTADTAFQAYKNIRQAGFTNCSIDLMFAVPGQTLADWKKDLQKAVALGPEHISLYGFSFEKGTPMELARQKGELGAAKEQLYADMYLKAINTLTRAGYRHYEISNFAHRDRECRHNLGYWQHRPYLGLGAAAHSYYDTTRRWNVADVGEYVARLTKGELPVEDEERLTDTQMQAEYVFLHLRTRTGLETRAFTERFGIDFLETYTGQLEKLTLGGYVETAGKYVRLTEKGLLVADTVLSEFM